MFPKWHVRLSLRSTQTGAEEEIVFRKDRIAVGRGAGDTDVVLPKTSVSRRHCVLMVDGRGEVHVADAGSTNGTYLNGRRLPRAQPYRLGPRDELTVGDVCLSLAAAPERVDSVMQRSALIEQRR